jgi:dTDP-4-dehydrorhamnose 3,5-epimerase
MKFLSTSLPGVVVVEPQLFRDERGFFLETWHAQRYADAGITALFVQDNHSRSCARTLRGLHAQRRRPQGKLVRVVLGEIYDVAVDIRRGSPTFARFVAERLSAENFRQVYIPPGFAHGFAVLSEVAEVEYKCTDFYDRGDEITIAWNDPAIGIPWPLDDPILSDKDRAAKTLAEMGDLLPEYEGPEG